MSDDQVEEGFEPFLIGNILYTKDRKIIGFYIEASNLPGVISEIARAFEENSTSILSLVFSSKIQSGVRGSLFIATEMLDPKVSVEEVRAALEGIEDIYRVETVQPQHPQLMVDPYHFPIVDETKTRSIIFSEVDIESLIISFIREYGVGGRAFLYHQGRVTGFRIAEENRRIGAINLIDSLNMLLLKSFAKGRYRGEITYYYYEEGARSGYIAISLYDSWECETAKRHGVRGPASHFERGVIAGLVEACTGRKAVVEETMCIAKGDPHCEFRVVLSMAHA